jgi:hypothetical protein
MRVAFLLTIVALSAGPAMAQGKRRPQPEQVRAEPVRVVPADSVAEIDVGGGMTDQTRLVVRDTATWLGLRAQLFPARSSVQPTPVDFSRFILLVVAAGAEAGGETDITIDSLVEGGGHDLRVAVTTRRMGRQCSGPAAFNTPTKVLRVPRRATVRFHDRTVTDSLCGARR